MRRYFLSFSLVIATALVFAQDQKGPSASYNTIPEEKGPSVTVTTLNHQPAVKLVLPYAPEAVMTAMAQYEINCYRPEKKQSTAYVAFDKTALMNHNKKGAPLVFHIGPTDAKHPNQSVVYLLLHSYADKGDFAGTVNRFDTNDAIAYLDNLAVAVQGINLDNQIKANIAKLKKEEALQKRCANRCERLNDRKEALQQKLAQNKSGTVKREKRLTDRLVTNQDNLAVYKASVEKQRSDLTILEKQKKAFNKRVSSKS